MTKTQANEPGFVQLPDGWLAIEMKAAEAEIAKWPAGLRSSFDSLFRAAAPIVPAPAYGVKKLEWEEPSKATNGCWVAKTEFGTYSAINDDGWYVTTEDAPWGRSFEWSSEDLQKDTLDTAKAAAQADFGRRVLSCLSSAPVEEADAKAGEPSDYVTHHSDWRKACQIAKDAAQSEADQSYWQHQIDTLDRLAPTIPSEPEAKGEAGAGPVGVPVYELEWTEPRGRYSYKDLFLTTWRGKAPGGEYRVEYVEANPNGSYHKRKEDPYYFEPYWQADRCGRVASLEEGKTAAQAHYAAHIRSLIPARPVEEPDEVERITRERDEAIRRGEDQWAGWVREGVARKTAEASLAETRVHLEKVEAERDRLRAFASSFHITVATSSVYQDTTLHLDHPHSLALRLNNDSSKSWLFHDLEDRRRAALSTQESSAALAGDGKEVVR